MSKVEDTNRFVTWSGLMWVLLAWQVGCIVGEKAGKVAAKKLKAAA